MRLLGLAPGKVFSGFETSFFNAISAQGAGVRHIEIEIPWFKILCTLGSVHPNRKRWGTRRDRLYHTSIAAFRSKSARARKYVERLQDEAEAVYQVGSLWNPLGGRVKIPLILHVDYTSLLSKRRGSEWKRRPGRSERFWIRAEEELYRTAAVVLTTTENARQSIIDDYGIDAGHVVTVGAGVSSPYDHLEPGRFPDYASRQILFVGKGYHGKGLDTVLEAFQSVRESVPEAQLTVVGPTGEDIGGPGINYLGRIADRNAVRELYYKHALFVMPSRFEPLGQVFLEAMSCRLPCIGTTVDAMPEIIEHDQTGYVIEPGDSRRLAKYMTAVLTDEELAARMGAAGYQRLTKQYTWPVVGKKIFDTIRTRVLS